jgi:hypothetical protein
MYADVAEQLKKWRPKSKERFNRVSTKYIFRGLE